MGSSLESFRRARAVRAPGAVDLEAGAGFVELEEAD
jgi:hypothetical protein